MGIIIYGAIASMLPVWLLLAPRDYLSTFLKIGVVVALAIGIYLVQPDLKMQAVTRFADGTGPVFSGPLFPFLFITIACGAVSGFHSLISSGTTPKMIERESHARFVGYGGMLMESFVAMMALSAACVLDPGIYFAMNSPAAVIGNTPQRAAEVISSWGWVITPEAITQTAADVGEHTILNRAGGAPTLAVGMAQIMAQAFGGKALEAFWYHFAILFERCSSSPRWMPAPGRAADPGRSATSTRRSAAGRYSPTWSPRCCASPAGAGSSIRALWIRSAA